MYCRNCGNEINDRAVVCIHCGCAVEQPSQPAKPEQKINVLAIVGFVMTFIMPIAGLICSILGYKRADSDYNGNCKNLALAGTILSAIFLALIVVAVILYILLVVGVLGVLVSITPPYYAIMF